MLQTHLPHRFRESEFRRYEPFIAVIAEKFPDVVAQDVKQVGLSPVTYACRLRDALKSYRNNKWKSDSIPLSFFDVIDQVVVSDRGNGIIAAGSKDSLKDPNILAVAQPPKHVAESTLSVDTLSATPLLIVSTDLNALCFLAHSRALKRPLSITISSPELASSLEQQYDISLDNIGNNQYILL